MFRSSQTSRTTRRVVGIKEAQAVSSGSPETSRNLQKLGYWRPALIAPYSINQGFALSRDRTAGGLRLLCFF